MNYAFPIIRHLDDVLPHIEGREEFIVAEREGYTVVNYVVAMADTFDIMSKGVRIDDVWYSPKTILRIEMGESRLEEI
jgi:hypothetical protein